MMIPNALYYQGYTFAYDKCFSCCQVRKPALISYIFARYPTVLLPLILCLWNAFTK